MVIGQMGYQIVKNDQHYQNNLAILDWSQWQ